MRRSPCATTVQRDERRALAAVPVGDFEHGLFGAASSERSARKARHARNPLRFWTRPSRLRWIALLISLVKAIGWHQTCLVSIDSAGGNAARRDTNPHRYASEGGPVSGNEAHRHILVTVGFFLACIPTERAHG